MGKSKAESGAGAPKYWIEWFKWPRDSRAYGLRIVHRNGRIVFQGQGYSRKVDAMRMVRNFAQAMVDNQVEIREGKA